METPTIKKKKPGPRKKSKPRVKFNGGAWTDEEKILFLIGLKKYGKGRWKEIGNILKSRSTVQIKSRGQKIVQKMMSGVNVFEELEQLEKTAKFKMPEPLDLPPLRDSPTPPPVQKQQSETKKESRNYAFRQPNRVKGRYADDDDDEEGYFSVGEDEEVYNEPDVESVDSFGENSSRQSNIRSAASEVSNDGSSIATPPGDDSTDNVLVVMSKGSEELDVVTCSSILSQFGVKVTVCSFADRLPSQLEHKGLALITNEDFQKCLERQWQLIVLPGGRAGANSLQASDDFCKLLKKHVEQDVGLVAALGASAKSLLPALGFIDSLGETCYPLRDSPVVITERDKQIWTTAGHDTAEKLARAVGEHLFGTPKAIKETTAGAEKGGLAHVTPTRF